jgi:hypothetical protein
LTKRRKISRGCEALGKFHVNKSASRHLIIAPGLEA